VICVNHSHVASSYGTTTGKGALGIWTHHLNAIDVVLNYSSPEYWGAAMTMGAGVQTRAAMAAANSHGYRIVGSSCPAVGTAGGFT
jgi:hypothetical protein